MEGLTPATGRPRKPRESGPREALTARRQELGLSQQELADDLDVAQTHVSHIELGDATPSFPLAMRIAKRLRSKVEKLFPDVTS